MRRPFLLFLTAGMTALLAALVVYSALTQREAALQRATAQDIRIVVASRTLPIGSVLDASSLKLVLWSRDAVPSSSYTEPRALIGKVVKNGFIENEPIVGPKLFTGDKTAGVLPLLIPPGMRAVSVPVDEVSDVAGFVQPKTRVDVIVALTNFGAEARPFSKLVLQNEEVLAVAQEIEGDKDKPKVVKVITLLVTPEEAERLALASSQGGSIRLAIRSYQDNKIVLTGGSDIATLKTAYSLSPRLPAIRTQAVNDHSHFTAARRDMVNVQIFRNGTSSESLSFIVGAPFNAFPLTSSHKRPEPKKTISAVGIGARSAAVGFGDVKRASLVGAEFSSGRADAVTASNAALDRLRDAAPEHAPEPKTINVH